MVIPTGLYALCERRRRRRYTAIQAAERQLARAREAAESARGSAPDPNGGSRGSGRGDGLERAAIRVAEAEERLRQAMAWDDCFVRMDRIYPAGTVEDTISRMLYDKGFSQAGVCEALRMHRITVRRKTDNYVINLALLAVQAGLTRIEEDTNESKDL